MDIRNWIRKDIPATTTGTQPRTDKNKPTVLVDGGITYLHSYVAIAANLLH